MRQIFVRPARFPQEAELIKAFAALNSAWDANALPYSYIWCVQYTGDTILGYMPMQRPLMLEAIAFNPIAHDIERARAMQELVQTTITHAYEMGIGEIFFLGSHRVTNEFAVHHGFQLVDMPLYRLRLRELEQGGKTNGT